MTALEFFYEMLSFIGKSITDLLEILYNFTPVNIVLSIMFGVMVFALVIGIIRGRKL